MLYAWVEGEERIKESEGRIRNRFTFSKFHIRRTQVSWNQKYLGNVKKWIYLIYKLKQLGFFDDTIVNKLKGNHINH